MKSVKCPSCGAKMKRNGKTSAGRQRWRCPGCGASTTVRRDGDAAELREFLGWLMSKGSQLEMPGQGRTFRRRTARFWELWPMPAADGEWHRVLYVDGIWLAHDLVVLVCRSDERVVSWYMARSETSRAWSALMDPIPAPDVVVADGGTGFASAVRRSWPGTRVQRCVFHVFCQVRRYTTSRPRLQAGVELYGLAGDLLRIGTLHQAELWVERYLQWCGFWADFLEDTSVIDGRRVFTHERLRKARSSLSRLVSEGTLFTYLDPELTEAGPLPSTNNAAESLNARLREMLRNHRVFSQVVLSRMRIGVERYLQWCGFWADFLEDTSVIDGRRVFTHERLRKARSSLTRLVSEGTLFTYLDPELTEAGPLPSTNNAAESLNARLLEMLRNHRVFSQVVLSRMRICN